MAEIKGSELDPAVSIIGTDIVVGVEDGGSVKIKAEDILMTKSLTAVRWGSNRQSPNASKTGGSKDPDFAKFKDNGSGSQGVFLWHFDAAAEEELYFDASALPDYKEGSTFYVQIFWIPSANGSAAQKVSWGIEMNLANPGEVFGNTVLVYADTSTPDETLVAGKLYYTEFTFPIATLMIGGTSAARLFRDATGAGGTDTYTSDAILISVEIKYEIDALGASTRTVK